LFARYWQQYKNPAGSRNLLGYIKKQL